MRWRSVADAARDDLAKGISCSGCCISYIAVVFAVLNKQVLRCVVCISLL